MSHHIVFLDRDTVAPQVNIRRPDFEHTYEEYGQTVPEQVLERAKDATILIVNKVPLREETLKQLPKLKMIAVAATGTDPFDTAWCKDHGIVVSNIRNYAMTTVPEHTFALILALKRSIIPYHQAVKAGRWQDSGQFCFFDYPINNLRGCILGIYGEGSIGYSVAEIAKAFGMIPKFAAHKGVKGLGPLYTPWDEVVETADIHTCHCPLIPQTRNMLAMPEFKRMKRNSIIVNTARGGLVNEEDLATALREGLIAGAGFDVATPPEPPSPDNPLMHLMDLPNFILTPHIAWASTEAQQGLVDQMIGHIENFVAGKPSNVVGEW